MQLACCRRKRSKYQYVAAQCKEATSFAEAYATDNAGEWQAEQLSTKLIEEARGLAEEHLQLWKTGGLPEQQQQQKKKQTERMAKLQVQWETMYNKMTEAQLQKCQKGHRIRIAISPKFQITKDMRVKTLVNKQSVTSS